MYTSHPSRLKPQKGAGEKDSGKNCILSCEKRKADDTDINKDLKKAKLETKALKAKRPGFTDDRYNETSYYIENGLRKVYPYYFTFTTFTKGRWVGEKILDVFAREFRAHPAAEYERCIRAGTLTVNYERVDPDYRLKHNDLLANVVHRHEVPVTSQPITLVHIDEDIVVVNKPASIPKQRTVDMVVLKGNCNIIRLYKVRNETMLCPWWARHETPVLASPLRIIHVDEELLVLDKPCSLPVHPCGRYRHNTVVFILAKEYNLKNLRTIHRLDRLTSEIECQEPIEVVSYKIGVCKVSAKGKDCSTVFKRLGYNAASNTSVVLCKPKTGRMHQIRVHLQYLGYPVVNDPLYNHPVFGPLRGKGGDTGGKSDEQLVRDLIAIHNAENWLGVDAADDDLLFSKPVSDDKATLPSPSSGAEAPSEVNSPVCTLAPSPVASPSFNEDSNDAKSDKVTVATQTGCTPAATSQASGLASSSASGSTDALSSDPHCYECRVRYRDPRPRDLVMYLHAWKYKGPGWEYETELPQWASIDWDEPESS
ncbi:unnamed protein product [Spodoptera littoralis]|uniref:Pseudouridine synthase RsuA/RluA-like domain-containing protein n=1 Tax=Spodoptera littoralis TaxID=7109 RepID=A0A9P0IFA9_SPOLI|nr:unnamed protein product [Spodoptera littoralis]CAH1645150.1 unnamed protein product [Spodoptera littoralis]